MSATDTAPAFANTASRYGSISKWFHWTTALLIITLFPLGVIANDLAYQIKAADVPDPAMIAQAAWLFSLHKTIGIALFFVALARIIWALTQTKPQPIHAERKLETFAAETAHWVLYSSLVIVPLSGWIHHAATSGFAPIWWPLGQTLPLIPQSAAVADLFAGVHIVVTKVLLVAMLAHIAGALKHVVIDRDGTLARMWFGKTEVAGQSAHSSTRPIIAAAAAWLAALGIGAGLGVYDNRGSIAEAAQLEAVASEWAVQDGSIAITVTQFGSAVKGSFADWTAAISFDETVAEGPAGTAEVTVSIGSLTLGSVTDQAMGTDYFNTAEFPTATFTAELIAVEGGHVATGTLRIRDQEQPVEMPFTVTVDGDTATASGMLSVNRLDFNIGQSTQDESTLAFAVDIAVDLTATRGE
ncbi:MAG: cytochrome b/b6 domain-containing protein [Pseudomonadota bacterium]